MPYTIGDRRITLDSDISESDRALLVSHFNMFKFCLNNALFKYFINLKKIVHLYSDIITIYATLLRKIPNYDDITVMTNKCKLHVLAFEDDYNELFGPYTTSLQEYKKVNSNWEEKSYSNNIQPSSLELIGSTLEIFEEISKNLVLIDLFFESFNNLKKLLIPFLNEQTKSVIQSLVKLKQFLNVTISVDQPLDLEDYNELVNMKKVEKITSGIERESIILETAFLTFNTSLKQYTSILLGKAILKRDVDARDCELIARRAICYQAAEHVVSIPLTEDSPNKNNNPMEYLSKYLAYVVFSLVILVSIILYRLFKVLLS